MDVLETPTAELDGLTIHLLDTQSILAKIYYALSKGQSLDVSYVNAHVLNCAQDDAGLHSFLKTIHICYCDGMGPVWALRSQGASVPGSIPGRLAIPELMAAAETYGWRVSWIGGESGVVDQAIQKLKGSFPNVRIGWTGHGFQKDSDLETTLRALKDSQSDILLVGMGTPIQERWVQTHRNVIDIPIVWCVGATADYLSGTRRLGPMFFLKHQEWLARLIMEPKIMWRRYLLGNPRFVTRTVKGRLWKHLRKKH